MNRSRTSLEVVNEPDPEPEVEESFIETHVDLLVELITEILSFSAIIRIHLSLRPRVRSIADFSK